MNGGEKPSSPGEVVPQPKVRPVKFTHEKGTQFRTYHADGMWGVVNAQGNLNMHFYVEFPRLADAAISPVNPDGSFTGELKLLGAGESDPTYYLVTRDFQCNVVLSLASAISTRDQLNFFIDSAQAHLKSAAVQLITTEKK
jgi:hypothetical protein